MSGKRTKSASHGTTAAGESPNSPPDREKTLLLAVMMLLAVGLSALWLAPAPGWKQTSVLMAVLWAGCLLVHIHSTSQPDRSAPSTRSLLPILALLAGFGLLLQASLGVIVTDGTLQRGAWSFALAPVFFVAGGLLISSGVLARVMGLWPLWLITGYGIFGGLLFAGQARFGSRFGPGYSTPGEFAKILLLMGLAGLFVRGGRLTSSSERLPASAFPKVFVASLLLWFMPQLVLVKLRDFGSILLLNGCYFGVFFLLSRQVLLLLGVATVGGAGALFIPQRFPHVLARFDAWLDPWQNVHGSGYQLVQSLMALNAGGMLGRGLGNGVPDRIPFASSDFIFAVIAEEFGFLGAVSVLLAITMIVLLGFRSARQQGNWEERTFLSAATVLLGLQALVNIGGVCGAIPITGVPLPFLSKGGTSLLACSLLLGCLAAPSVAETPRRKATTTGKPTVRKSAAKKPSAKKEKPPPSRKAASS